MPELSRAATRAADSLAADLLNKTVWLGSGERPDVLEAIARIIQARASELREQRIERNSDA